MEFDLLVEEGANFVWARLPVDASLFGFLIMDLPRLLGKALAHVFGVFGQIVTDLAERRERFRVVGNIGGHPHRFLLAASRDGRRHERLPHVSGPAERAKEGSL